MYIWARKASNTFSKTFDGNEEAYRKGCTLLLKRVRAIRFCALLLARLFFCLYVLLFCFSFHFVFSPLVLSGPLSVTRACRGRRYLHTAHAIDAGKQGNPIELPESSAQDEQQVEEVPCVCVTVDPSQLTTQSI